MSMPWILILGSLIFSSIATVLFWLINRWQKTGIENRKLALVFFFLFTFFFWFIVAPFVGLA